MTKKEFEAIANMLHDQFVATLYGGYVQKESQEVIENIVNNLCDIFAAHNSLFTKESEDKFKSVIYKGE